MAQPYRRTLLYINGEPICSEGLQFVHMSTMTCRMQNCFGALEKLAVYPVLQTPPVHLGTHEVHPKLML